eukprot:scaffold276_cov548-Prasinococcus_capsulatus_cf.AAC.14
MARQTHPTCWPYLAHLRARQLDIKATALGAALRLAWAVAAGTTLRSLAPLRRIRGDEVPTGVLAVTIPTKQVCKGGLCTAIPLSRALENLPDEEVRDGQGRARQVGPQDQLRVQLVACSLHVACSEDILRVAKGALDLGLRERLVCDGVEVNARVARRVGDKSEHHGRAHDWAPGGRQDGRLTTRNGSVTGAISSKTSVSIGARKPASLIAASTASGGWSRGYRSSRADIVTADRARLSSTPSRWLPRRQALSQLRTPATTADRQARAQALCIRCGRITPAINQSVVADTPPRGAPPGKA